MERRWPSGTLVAFGAAFAFDAVLIILLHEAAGCGGNSSASPLGQLIPPLWFFGTLGAVGAGAHFDRRAGRTFGLATIAPLAIVVLVLTHSAGALEAVAQSLSCGFF